ncbi:hypothetical protein WDU94_003330 [Cyamophila willieti]
MKLLLVLICALTFVSINAQDPNNPSGTAAEYVHEQFTPESIQIQRIRIPRKIEDYISSVPNRKDLEEIGVRKNTKNNYKSSVTSYIASIKDPRLELAARQYAEENKVKIDTNSIKNIVRLNPWVFAYVHKRFDADIFARIDTNENNWVKVTCKGIEIGYALAPKSDSKIMNKGECDFRKLEFVEHLPRGVL